MSGDHWFAQRVRMLLVLARASRSPRAHIISARTDCAALLNARICKLL